MKQLVDTDQADLTGEAHQHKVVATVHEQEERDERAREAADFAKIRAIRAETQRLKQARAALAEIKQAMRQAAGPLEAQLAKAGEGVTAEGVLTTLRVIGEVCCHPSNITS